MDLRVHIFAETNEMIAHLTLATTDVPALAQFYQDTLGWKYIHHPGNVATDCAWLDIGSGQQIHILRVADFQTSPFEAEYGRHVAIFQSGEDFAATRQRLEAKGVEILPPERDTPFPRYFFRDPEGYMIEVVHQELYQENREA